MKSFPVSNSADPGTTGCPGILTVNINWDDPAPVYGVIIHLDQGKIGNWNEIDAVELVGFSSPDGAGTTDPSEGGNNPSGLADALNVNNNSDDGDYTFDGDPGMTVTCDDGRSFNNGVQVTVVQMRSGFNYTATAVGLNGFDPILAVLDQNTGRGLCTDDDPNGAAYSLSLPTTGQVNPSPTNSQITFANNSRNAFADVALVVGGFDNSAGEFVLILEGMARTAADGDGDPFSLQITPGMIASGVSPTAYMISVSSRFDPLMAIFSPDDGYLSDSNGNPYACDDAGYSCWGDSVDLSRYYVSRTRGRQLPGGNLDSMLTLPIGAGMEFQYFNYMMSSAQGTQGDYIVAFHIGTK